MSAKLRNPSDRSNTSAVGTNTGTPNMEYFWACEMNASKRSVEWSVSNEDLEEGDEDYIDHSLFVRSICLGAGAVDKEENIVEMESVGENGEMFKGTIANLTKGVNAMGHLSFTIDGKNGVKFTLVEGSGPISICGNHLLDYPPDDDLDMSQTEESKLEDTDEEEEDEEAEEEEEKAKPKPQKRKAPVVLSKKQKQKAKTVAEDDEDDDDDEEDEDEDDDDDEDFDDEEEESDSDAKAKKGKRGAAKPQESGKKGKGAAKTAPAKEGKKQTKKAKK